MFTLSDGFPARIQGITNCGNQLCVNWLLPSLGKGKKSDAALPSKPFTLLKLEGPKDGSDYQGPPKKKR
jgi:hypothetical protein